MKNILFITMLLGVGYSQCNESNWQEYYPDMQGCFLAGADLYEADLSGADLSGANLLYADLFGADLSGANLSGADCFLASFIFANLENTIFTNANLIYAYLDATGDCDEGNLWDGFTSCNSDNDCPANSGCGLWGNCYPISCDGYDDVSYEAGAESVDITSDNQASYDAGYETGAMSGDSNLDGTLDVLDMVNFIEVILNP